MINSLSIIGVFTAGLISFFSPCVLPLIPAYLGYISGDSENKRTILSRSIGFVVGFTIIFTLMGATASFIGGFIFDNQLLLMRIGGIILIILGIQMTGIININFLSKEKRKRMPKVASWFSSILIGMVFAAGWTPCIGPILGSVLVYASQANTMNQGIYYLLIYSLGIGIPFIISALLIQQIEPLVNKFNKGSLILKKIAGLVIFIFGLLMFLDKLRYLNNITF